MSPDRNRLDRIDAWWETLLPDERAELVAVPDAALAPWAKSSLKLAGLMPLTTDTGEHLPIDVRDYVTHL
jgi:hypothetical protein